MKLLVTLSLAVLACAAQAPARRLSDKEELGLKGPVKSVRTMWVGVPRGESKSPAYGWAVDTEVTFDREGRKLSDERFDPEGKSWGRSVFSYQDGWSVQTQYHSDGSLFQKLVTKVRLDKRSGTLTTTVTQTLGQYEGAPHSTIVERFDARGRSVETTYYLLDGKLASRSNSRFDADGYLLRFVDYSAAGAVLTREVAIEGGLRHYLYGPGGIVLSVTTMWKEVCAESDAYGNCKRETALRTVGKPGGAVVKIDEITTRSFTYY